MAVSQLNIYFWSVTDSTAVIDLLPMVERLEAERMSSPVRRHEYVSGRFLLRSVAREHLQIALPEQMLINEHGKPTFASGPNFNISHSDNLVAVALHDEIELGLDIQIESNVHAAGKILQRLGSNEEHAEFSRLAPAEQAAFFCQLWTLKESYVKAHGLAVGAHLKDLRFDFARGQIVATPRSDRCEFIYGPIHIERRDVHFAVCAKKNVDVVNLWRLRCRAERSHFDKLAVQISRLTYS